MNELKIIQAEVTINVIKVGNKSLTKAVFNQIPIISGLNINDTCLGWVANGLGIRNRSYLIKRNNTLFKISYLTKAPNNIYEVENKILGFIIYDLKASTLFLRYWFVKPNYRDLRIGSKLFNEFLLRGKDTHRQMFWVIRSNENAINRYLHYGFKEEIMYNFVYTNKPLKYEN